MSDDFGDRMKGYEQKERFMPLLPVVARIDGKRFSRWTKGLNRPYDEDFSHLMIEVTKRLVDETHAKIGYTQSDEITLVFHADDHKSQIFLDGREQKMVSILASMTSAFFNDLRHIHLPAHPGYGPAFFDCRAFAVPNKVEAANAVLWRVQDATKNAVSMVARAYFSHKSLHGMSGPEMQERLFQEAGVNFNDYPAFFKRGTFVQRRSKYVTLDQETLEKIPEDKRPTGPVKRSKVVELMAMPRFGSVTNRVEVIFDGADPEVAE